VRSPLLSPLRVQPNAGAPLAHPAAPRLPRCFRSWCELREQTPASVAALLDDHGPRPEHCLCSPGHHQHSPMLSLAEPLQRSAHERHAASVQDPQLDPVVRRMNQILLGSEVPLRRLNRSVAKHELDLLKLAAGRPALPLRLSGIQDSNGAALWTMPLLVRLTRYLLPKFSQRE